MTKRKSEQSRGQKAFLKAYEPFTIPDPGNPPTKLGAMVKGRCPKCRRGPLFSTSFFSSSFHKMNQKCPHCNFQFEIEPGFFWGAMYLNYGFSVFTSGVTGGLVIMLVNDPTIWHFLLSITAILVIVSPIMFRYSRILLLHLLGFVTFDKKLYKNYLHKHN